MATLSPLYKLEEMYLSGPVSCRSIILAPSFFILAMLISASPGLAAGAMECWRGWGYRVDAATQTYTSGELLLVTKGPAVWEPGRPVTLYLLDRASGQIAVGQSPMTVVPGNPRVYYRGSVNYVDGRGRLTESADHLAFGLSHVAPSGLEKMQEYNTWACGLEGAAE